MRVYTRSYRPVLKASDFQHQVDKVNKEVPSEEAYYLLANKAPW